MGAIREAFFRNFADRYFPGPAVDGTVDEATAKQHAAALAGSYISSRRAESSFLSILNLLQPAKVVVNEDGTISFPILTDLNGEPTKWREVAPWVWREVDGKSRLAAEVKDGKVIRFTAEWISPFMYMERSSGAKGVGWLMPALIAGLAALTLTVLVWPVAALVRRHYKRPLPFAGREAKAYRWVRIGALLSLAAVGGWIGTILLMFSKLELLTAGMDWVVLTLHVLGTIAVFAGLALAIWHLIGRVEGAEALARQALGRRAGAGDRGLRLGRGCLPSGRHQHELLMQLSVTRELIPLSAPFTITGYTFTDMTRRGRARRGARRGRRRRGRRRLLPRRRRRAHVRRARGRAPRRRGGHRPRVARAACCRRAARATPSTARSGTSRPSGSASRSGASRARAAAPAPHHVHHPGERSGGDGGESASSTPRRSR